MRGARHDVGDGVQIIVISRAIIVKILVEPSDTIWIAPNRLQAERDAVVREREFDVTQARSATELARGINPQFIKRGE